ncbi:MAG: rRNA maturation RNase YbeY [Oscillospiraceae bacterium]|jgi:probable rRNA maturation factor|nr:rRNA maturation RNase YbeY [Oscillospiraceae bacterium]
MSKQDIEISRSRGIKRPVPYRVIRSAVRAALNAEHSDGHVSVLICGRGEIRRLNREFRDTDRVTDVLSFPDGNGGGDIALCAGKIPVQARRFGHSAAREAAYLCVHSVLHLLGYDHVNGEEERAAMRVREEEIMNSIGLKRQGAK